jgi:hypothetical protein
MEHKPTHNAFDSFEKTHKKITKIAPNPKFGDGH